MNITLCLSVDIIGQIQAYQTFLLMPMRYYTMHLQLTQKTCLANHAVFQYVAYLVTLK